ncbi:glycosyltransferase [Granulicella paludicola]|uniref:glycosyltransferase n=1 Tax=Granulicella paludicola TaxID=474951 RepID=UPI0021E069BE|nr:glycosyltransferase [Granulicella paludicola]
MHIFIIAIGSAGDVHPFVGMARSFAAEGHRVSFCTNPAFEDVVTSAGLPIVPLGTADEYHRAMNDPALWDPRTSFRVLWKTMSSFLRPLLEILHREVGEGTIMVGSLWAFGARMMQEKYGIPYVSVQVSPSTFLSAKLPPVHKRFVVPAWWPYRLRAVLLWAIERVVLDSVCGPELNAVRKEMGLPRVKHVLGQWVHSPQGVLGLFPDWFAPIQTDWPAKVSLSGFPLYDRSASQTLDEELITFLLAGQKPVVFTPGSTHVDELTYFGVANDSLRRLGERGIFLAKRSAKLPPFGTNILVREYVPLSLLLQHAKALVHHGGIGTASHALAQGIPQLVIPFAHDQFDNAARLERLGCSRTLRRAVWSARRFLNQLL